MSSSRGIQRETVKLGKIFQASLYSGTASMCRDMLQKKLMASSSKLVKAQTEAKKYVLDELVHKNHISLDEVYEDYISKIPEQYHPPRKHSHTAMQTFVDMLTNQNTGLPILLVRSKDSSRTVLLFEEIGNERNYHSMRNLDDILCTNFEDSKHSQLKDLQNVIKSHFCLLNSAREKAIFVSMLSTIFSTTDLRFHIGIKENHTANLKAAVQKYSEAAIEKEEEATHLAKEVWRRAIQRTEISLVAQEETMIRQKHSLSAIEIERREEDTQFLKERLVHLKGCKASFVKKVARISMKKWKNTLQQQKEKGKGRVRIDRGAEVAVFHALQEQLTAHVKRKDAPELEKRVHNKELRQIANKWLEQHGKSKIRSYETVRSWGRTKRKGTHQSKQHRGQSLWRYKRPKKSYTEEHPNLHYNRAHIKQYMRLLFSRNHRISKRFTLRRCMDDKAYLRCGTSEGFSRPRTKPLMLVDEEPTLPAYDFPEKCGYVAPGVHLIINDMEEKTLNEKDKFALTDATISVICKPKQLYNSSATNWANDMYSTRLEYPEEHEIKDTSLKECARSQETALVFLQDSLRQFSLMTIPKDYINVPTDELFKQREQMRLQVLSIRTLYVLQELQPLNPMFVHEYDRIQEMLLAVQNLECKLHDKCISSHTCEKEFCNIKQEVEETAKILDPLTPKFRPVDIQTTDAGPGVGTAEGLVRLRLTESFLIHDLDLQARFHYAPRDSKAHKVEQVMSALNDACGDGRFIDIQHNSLLETLGEERLLQMTPEEFKKEKTKQETLIGQQCAQKAAAKYDGSRSMGTSIHARTPDPNNPYHKFYFDENFMKRCHEAPASKKDTCPGIGYYEFLIGKFDEIYIRYNNGIEGRRTSGEWRSGNPVDRVPPPVPNYEDSNGNGKWHYFSLRETPEEFIDATKRTPDDFCPIVQLRKYVVTAGEPNISCCKNPDGTAVVVDQNNTWSKILQGFDDFVAKYLGLDLHHVALKAAEALYLSKLTKLSKKLKKHGLIGKVDITQMLSVQTGRLKITISKSSVPSPLPWNGIVHQGTSSAIEMVNTCTVDNLLFFCHTLLTNRADLRRYFEQSPLPVYRRLLEVHKAFSEGQYAQGKLVWFRLFQAFDEVKRIDAHGSEDEYFFSRTRDITSTVYTSKCSAEDCPCPEAVHTGSVICFRSFVICLSNLSSYGFI